MHRVLNELCRVKRCKFSPSLSLSLWGERGKFGRLYRGVVAWITRREFAIRGRTHACVYIYIYLCVRSFFFFFFFFLRMERIWFSRGRACLTWDARLLRGIAMRCLRVVLEDLRREILLHRGSVSCKSSKLIDIKIRQFKLLVGLLHFLISWQQNRWNSNFSNP